MPLPGLPMKLSAAPSIRSPYLPLTVGPGSISVAITLGANTTRTHIDLWAFIIAILIAITLVAVSIYICYRFAENMARLLGRNGTSIFLRLSSFILLCIGVQIFWNGASALLGSLAHDTHKQIAH
jgi:multiple antibiotic resistance protein